MPSLLFPDDPYFATFVANQLAMTHISIDCIPILLKEICPSWIFDG